MLAEDFQGRHGGAVPTDVGERFLDVNFVVLGPPHDRGNTDEGQRDEHDHGEEIASRQHQQDHRSEGCSRQGGDP